MDENKEIEMGLSIEEIDLSDENIVEIEISEAFPFSADGILDDTLQNKCVLIDGGTPDGLHTSAIGLETVLENCAALGGSEHISHGTLNGREQPNQHPIVAIDGLREELDEIEALQVVYSNEKGIANYYLWSDNNSSKENRVGYFVSKCSDNKIKIIENKDEDVFGVTTDTSAFVGGQDNTPRNHQYGLIVSTGEVEVKCEADVAIGDYVTTNDYGIAKKATSAHGYRVNSTRKTNDFHYYATISLDVSSNQLDTLGTDIDKLESRMKTAETNITTANTLASTAYQLAKASNSGDIGALNASTVAKAEEALDKAESALANTENLNAQIQSAVQSATQAKTIAANAVATATSMKNEAIDKSNQALSEAVNIRKELEANVANINKELESAAAALQQTQDDVISTRDALQAEIDENKKSFEDLETDLTPLVEHSEGGVAGFVARADEESVVLATLTIKEEETSKALAGFKQEVAETYATTESLASLDTATSKAISDFKQEVAKDYATQELLTKYQTDANDALAGYKAEVAKEYATQQMLSSLETTTSQALSDYKQEVAKDYATQEMFTQYKTDTSQALADYKTEVAKNYATQQMVTDLETTTSKALSDYKQEVTDTYATQEIVNQYKQDASDALTAYKAEVSKDYATQQMLTDLETETSQALSNYQQVVTQTYATQEAFNSFKDETGTSLNTLKQYADENESYIQGFVANIDKYSYGKYSQANRFTYEEALNILEAGMVFVPKETRTETYKATEGYPERTCSFTRGFSYTWGTVKDKDDNDVTTWIGSAVQDVVFSVEYQEGGAFTYWVATDDCEHEGVTYYKDCLYKWERVADTDQHRWTKVAMLIENLGAITTSILKQTSNGIEMAIADVNNDYAGTKSWVDSNKAAIQDTVSWHGEHGDSLVTFAQEAGDKFAKATQIAQITDDDGNVTSASIMAIVEDGISSVNISADQITMDGTTTFLTPGDVGENGATVIDGGRITARTITAEHINVNDLSALEATIGGWKIDGNTLYAKFASELYPQDDTCGIYSGDASTDEPSDFAKESLVSDAYSSVRFFAGAPSTSESADGFDLSSAPFAVLNDGSLYASAAQIEGNITAIGGKIGGWSLSEKRLENYAGSEEEVNGRILYSNSFCMQIGHDNATNVLAIGKANPDWWNDASFRVTKEGELYANAVNITGGNLFISTPGQGDDYLSINSTTHGGLMMWRNIDLNNLYDIGGAAYPYVQMLGCGIYFGYASTFKGDVVAEPSRLMHRGNNVYLQGNWTTEVSESTSSDASLKHDIEPLDLRYDILFDNIIPRRFKYNSGLSDRYHSGYVTQEIQNALRIAEVSEKEFAAICTFNKGRDDEYSALRYSEFIPLNTWQIQKLKARVAELEERLSKLEAK